MNQKSCSNVRKVRFLVALTLRCGLANPLETGPLFVRSGQGSRIVTEDGDEFIDLVCSWGPLILGHAHPEVQQTIETTLQSGTTFGAPTRAEVEFAEAICEAVPSIEKVRAVSSGTEATMSAVRLARGYTGRDTIVKVDGGYHGHADMLLVAAGSGAATLGLPGSAGVTEGLQKTHCLSLITTLVL